jgi:hypothetical protein
MRFKSYNSELRIATAQFIDVFNDMDIFRGEDSFHNLITIPCVYGSRSRILKSAENRNKTLKLPLVAIAITNVTRDRSRVHSVNDSLFFNSDDYIDNTNNTAVPVNITYELTTITKYQEDMDHIISNFVVHFNPDIYVVWPHPYNYGNIKSQIVWNNDVNITYPSEIDEKTQSRVLATSTFILKTWIFPGVGGQYSDGDLIYKINLCDNPEYNQGLNKWYDVPTTMDMDAFFENVTSGLIKYPNYDHLQIIKEIDGYWIDVYGILSGSFLNPRLSGDLRTIIENFNDPNFALTTIYAGWPSHLQTSAYYDIFTRMLSSDLRNCFPIDPDRTPDIKNSGAYNPYLRWNYYITSDDIQYNGDVWASVGVVSWKSDGIWEGSTKTIPTYADNNDIINSQSSLYYDISAKQWKFDIFNISSMIFNGPTNAEPTGIYSNGNSNILIASTEIYNFIIALLDNYSLYNDTVFDLMEDTAVEIAEESAKELRTNYYIFSNTPIYDYDTPYLLVGQISRTSNDTWSGSVSAIPEGNISNIRVINIDLVHTEIFAWYTKFKLDTEHSFQRLYSYGNPHPEGVYGATEGHLIIDTDISKYINNFVINSGVITFLNQAENYAFHSI